MVKKAIDELEGIADRIQADRDVVRLYTAQAAQAVPMVVERLQGVKLKPTSVTITQPTLDDVFLQVTGQRLQTEDA